MKHWYDSDHLTRDEVADPVAEVTESIAADIALALDEGIGRDLALTPEEEDRVCLALAEGLLPEGWTLTPPQ